MEMHLNDCICFSLSKISRKMSKIYREKLEEYGITQPQFFLLIALYDEDNILISKLAEKVSLDRATLTGILDRLERDGYVERVFSKNDRRAIYIKLTFKATNMENKLRAIYEKTNSAILSKLSKEEYDTFQKIIYKLENI